MKRTMTGFLKTAFQAAFGLTLLMPVLPEERRQGIRTDKAAQALRVVAAVGIGFFAGLVFIAAICSNPNPHIVGGAGGSILACGSLGAIIGGLIAGLKMRLTIDVTSPQPIGKTIARLRKQV
jgi:membrane associated rhomboid family serine protease